MLRVRRRREEVRSAGPVQPVGSYQEHYVKKPAAGSALFLLADYSQAQQGKSKLRYESRIL